MTIRTRTRILKATKNENNTLRLSIELCVSHESVKCPRDSYVFRPFSLITDTVVEQT